MHKAAGSGWPWQLKCFLWVFGGTGALGFYQGFADGLGNPLGARLVEGVEFALLGFVVGFFIWLPLSLAAVLSGDVALAALRAKSAPQHTWARRVVFAVITSLGSAATAFSLLWLVLGGGHEPPQSGSVFLSACVVALVFFPAGLSYYPKRARPSTPPTLPESP